MQLAVFAASAKFRCAICHGAGCSTSLMMSSAALSSASCVSGRASYQHYPCLLIWGIKKLGICRLAEILVLPHFPVHLAFCVLVSKKFSCGLKKEKKREAMSKAQSHFALLCAGNRSETAKLLKPPPPTQPPIVYINFSLSPLSPSSHHTPQNKL